MRLLGSALGGLMVLLAGARPARAHGFGQRFDLPLPLEYFQWGAAAVVVLSFVVVAVFLRAGRGGGYYPRLNLLAFWPGRLVAYPLVLSVVRLFSVALFLLVLIAGFAGNPQPRLNIVPTAVWVYWWVGMGFFSALVGDLAALINPWKILFTWTDNGVRRLGVDEGLGLGYVLPTWVGAWPAVALFFGFAWVELVWGPASSVPANLAYVLVIYSVVTWTGMILFGRDEWLRRGEIFSIVFALFARFAPLEVRVTDPAARAACSSATCRDPAENAVNCYECFARAAPGVRQWNLRPYAVGLLTGAPLNLSMVVFVLLVLATVTFDGFQETAAWGSVLKVLRQALMPGATILHPALLTLGLFLTPVLFLAAFLVFTGLTGVDQPDHPPLLALAGYFVLSLVPIALAYHLAHYLLFFLIGGQLAIPLASDPLGLGWDLFGTKVYRINIGILGAKTAWYLAVGAIVVGHVAGVFLAHLQALRVFGDARAALKSQFPMLALMVGYTMISLWIITQPIVEQR